MFFLNDAQPTGSIIDKYHLSGKIFVFWYFLYTIFCQDLLVKHARQKTPGLGTGKSARGGGYGNQGRAALLCRKPGKSAIAGSINPKARKIRSEGDWVWARDLFGGISGNPGCIPHFNWEIEIEPVIRLSSRTVRCRFVLQVFARARQSVLLPNGIFLPDIFQGIYQ
jgi:hypothetical protein